MHVWMKSVLLGSAVAMVLSGCAAVGPDYHKPATPMPSGWAPEPPPSTGPATRTSQANTQAPDLAAWWTQFNDPELTSLVERAIQGNLDIQAAEARIRQARAQTGVASSAYWPNVNANGSYTRSRNPDGQGGGVESSNFRTGFDAAWELDVFGGTRRSVEAANAQTRAAIEDRRDVLVTLVSEVASNYLDLRGLQERVDISRRNLETQQRSVDLTRRQFKAGFIGSLDVTNAEAQVATTRAQIPVLESQIRQDIYNIALLLGMEPAALVQELSATAPIPGTPPQVPVGLPSELLRRRPDIRRAEAQLHAATAQIGVATADLFPKFTLTGTLGIGGSTLGALGNWSNNNWSFGPGVSWDIFSAGRIQSNIKVQEALRDQSTLSYRKTVLTALRDVESALVAYGKEQEHRQLLQTAVDQDRRAVDLAQQLYVAGQTDFLNVLNAQRSLLVAEEALSLSTQNVSTDLVSLYKALGGGWESPTPPASAAAPGKGAGAGNGAGAGPTTAPVAVAR